jgi:hypothetical protein
VKAIPVMKTYGGEEAQLHALLTSGIDGNETVNQ